jgi:hypothetical protein
MDECPQRLKPIGNMAVIAAVNRCATQKREQNRVFQQPLNVAPFPNPLESEFFRTLPGGEGYSYNA